MATGDWVGERELPMSLRGAGGADPAVADAALPTGQDPYAGLSLEDLERRAIVATLRETGDNKSEAARRLGITRATLHNKLKKYYLE